MPRQEIDFSEVEGNLHKYVLAILKGELPGKNYSMTSEQQASALKALFENEKINQSLTPEEINQSIETAIKNHCSIAIIETLLEKRKEDHGDQATNHKDFPHLLDAIEDNPDKSLLTLLINYGEDPTLKSSKRFIGMDISITKGSIFLSPFIRAMLPSNPDSICCFLKAMNEEQKEKFFSETIPLGGKLGNVCFLHFSVLPKTEGERKEIQEIFWLLVRASIDLSQTFYRNSSKEEIVNIFKLGTPLVTEISETHYKPFLKDCEKGREEVLDQVEKIWNPTILKVVDPESKQTPIHLLARRGHVSILNMLLKKYPDIVNPLLTQLDETAKKQTPLHLAVMGEHLETVRWLLDQGANPNSQDADGNTPLHYTMDVSDKEIGKEISSLLEKKGADPTIANQKNVCPKDFYWQKKGIFGTRPYNVYRLLFKKLEDYILCFRKEEDIDFLLEEHPKLLNLNDPEFLEKILTWAAKYGAASIYRCIAEKAINQNKELEELVKSITEKCSSLGLTTGFTIHMEFDEENFELLYWLRDHGANFKQPSNLPVSLRLTLSSIEEEKKKIKYTIENFGGKNKKDFSKQLKKFVGTLNFLKNNQMTPFEAMLLLNKKNLGCPDSESNKNFQRIASELGANDPNCFKDVTPLIFIIFNYPHRKVYGINDRLSALLRAGADPGKKVEGFYPYQFDGPNGPFREHTEVSREIIGFAKRLVDDINGIEKNPELIDVLGEEHFKTLQAYAKKAQQLFDEVFNDEGVKGKVVLSEAPSLNGKNPNDEELFSGDYNPLFQLFNSGKAKVLRDNLKETLQTYKRQRVTYLRGAFDSLITQWNASEECYQFFKIHGLEDNAVFRESIKNINNLGLEETTIFPLKLDSIDKSRSISEIYDLLKRLVDSLPALQKEVDAKKHEVLKRQQEKYKVLLSNIERFEELKQKIPKDGFKNDLKLRLEKCEEAIAYLKNQLGNNQTDDSEIELSILKANKINLDTLDEHLHWVISKLAKKQTMPPLHLAVQKGNYNEALRLIEEGADLTEQDSKGNTSLHIVLAKTGKFSNEMLLTMLEEKVKDDHNILEIKNNDGKRPKECYPKKHFPLGRKKNLFDYLLQELNIRIKRDSIEAVSDFLLNHPLLFPVNLKTLDLILSRAVHYGAIEVFKKWGEKALLNYGEEGKKLVQKYINAKGDNNNCLVHHITVSGRSDLFPWYVEHGADFSLIAEKGLDYPIFNRNLQNIGIRLLDVDRLPPDLKEWLSHIQFVISPLFIAILMQDTDLLVHLFSIKSIKKGINDSSQCGVMPMVLAVLNQKLGNYEERKGEEVIEILLQHGANPLEKVANYYLQKLEQGDHGYLAKRNTIIALMLLSISAILNDFKGLNENDQLKTLLGEPVFSNLSKYCENIYTIFAEIGLTRQDIEELSNAIDKRLEHPKYRVLFSKPIKDLNTTSEKIEELKSKYNKQKENSIRDALNRSIDPLNKPADDSQGSSRLQTLHQKISGIHSIHPPSENSDVPDFKEFFENIQTIVGSQPATLFPIQLNPSLPLFNENVMAVIGAIQFLTEKLDTLEAQVNQLVEKEIDRQKNQFNGFSEDIKLFRELRSRIPESEMQRKQGFFSRKPSLGEEIQPCVKAISRLYEIFGQQVEISKPLSPERLKNNHKDLQLLTAQLPKKIKTLQKNFEKQEKKEVESAIGALEGLNEKLDLFIDTLKEKLEEYEVRYLLLLGNDIQLPEGCSEELKEALENFISEYKKLLTIIGQTRNELSIFPTNIKTIEESQREQFFSTIKAIKNNVDKIDELGLKAIRSEVQERTNKVNILARIILLLHCLDGHKDQKQDQKYESLMKDLGLEEKIDPHHISKSKIRREKRFQKVLECSIEKLKEKEKILGDDLDIILKADIELLNQKRLDEQKPDEQKLDEQKLDEKWCREWYLVLEANEKIKLLDPLLSGLSIMQSALKVKAKKVMNSVEVIYVTFPYFPGSPIELEDNYSINNVESQRFDKLKKALSSVLSDMESFSKQYQAALSAILVRQKKRYASQMQKVETFNDYLQKVSSGELSKNKGFLRRNLSLEEKVKKCSTAIKHLLALSELKIPAQPSVEELLENKEQMKILEKYLPEVLPELKKLSERNQSDGNSEQPGEIEEESLNPVEEKVIINASETKSKQNAEKEENKEENEKDKSNKKNVNGKEVVKSNVPAIPIIQNNEKGKIIKENSSQQEVVIKVENPVKEDDNHQLGNEGNSIINEPLQDPIKSDQSAENSQSPENLSSFKEEESDIEENSSSEGDENDDSETKDESKSDSKDNQNKNPLPKNSGNIQKADDNRVEEWKVTLNPIVQNLNTALEELDKAEKAINQTAGSQRLLENIKELEQKIFVPSQKKKNQKTFIPFEIDTEKAGSIPHSEYEAIQDEINSLITSVKEKTEELKQRAEEIRQAKEEKEKALGFLENAIKALNVKISTVNEILKKEDDELPLEVLNKDQIKLLPPKTKKHVFFSRGATVSTVPQVQSIEFLSENYSQDNFETLNEKIKNFNALAQQLEGIVTKSKKIQTLKLELATLCNQIEAIQNNLPEKDKDSGAVTFVKQTREKIQGRTEISETEIDKLKRTKEEAQRIHDNLDKTLITLKETAKQALEELEVGIEKINAALERLRKKVGKQWDDFNVEPALLNIRQFCGCDQTGFSLINFSVNHVLNKFPNQDTVSTLIEKTKEELDKVNKEIDNKRNNLYMTINKTEQLIAIHFENSTIQLSDHFEESKQMMNLRIALIDENTSVEELFELLKDIKALKTEIENELKPKNKEQETFGDLSSASNSEKSGPDSEKSDTSSQGDSSDESGKNEDLIKLLGKIDDLICIIKEQEAFFANAGGLTHAEESHFSALNDYLNNKKEELKKTEYVKTLQKQKETDVTNNIQRLLNDLVSLGTSTNPEYQKLLKENKTAKQPDKKLSWRRHLFDLFAPLVRLVSRKWQARKQQNICTNLSEFFEMLQLTFNGKKIKSMKKLSGVIIKRNSSINSSPEIFCADKEILTETFGSDGIKGFESPTKVSMKSKHYNETPKLSQSSHSLMPKKQCLRIENISDLGKVFRDKSSPLR